MDGGFGPDEGPGVGVVAGDEAVDVGHEIGEALARLIHCMAGIRWRVSRKRLILLMN